MVYAAASVFCSLAGLSTKFGAFKRKLFSGGMKTSTTQDSCFFSLVLSNVAKEIFLDLSPLFAECAERHLAPFRWDDETNLFEIVVPLPGTSAREATAPSIDIAGISAYASDLRNRQGDLVPVWLIGQIIQPDGGYRSPSALTRHINRKPEGDGTDSEEEKDYRLVKAAAQAYTLAHNQKLSMPQPEPDLMQGHRCVERPDAPANNEQLSSPHAQLYRMGYCAVLSLPTSEVPSAQSDAVLSRCEEFLEGHGRERITISSSTGGTSRHCFQIVVPLADYNDLLNLARSLKFEIVSEQDS